MTDVPLQILFAEEEIEMPTDKNGFTVIVTVFDVAGFPETHEAFEVTTQVT